MSVVTSRHIVPPAMSILDEMGPSSSSGVAMKKGSFVMANYRGEGSFNAGRIESYDAANNTYSIKYEDGVMEFGVSEKIFRSNDKSNSLGFYNAITESFTVERSTRSLTGNRAKFPTSINCGGGPCLFYGCALQLFV